ncbi:uncharacterized protein LOC124937112 isoform X2 [Impatiens glandulifera]|uniref:uncharacterized protein LOC124937112 isoform X2 n=1 Tax=Impatiens glandulifera TaxID=253017 RepID=UPI001FB05B84|nr:uncharacterized protein LOC124937112 isoform X2 [Impatiens glandulifera]
MVVAGVRNEGGAQLLSVRVRKTIQSIKEIVGNHSDAEIYAALKECNMDPNETTQKLLNQDPFHEVKRKKDKKKENTGGAYKNFVDASRHNGHAGPGMKANAYPDRNNQRGGYTGTTSAGVNREFRVMNDSLAYPKLSGEPKPLLPNASGAHIRSRVSEKGLAGSFNNQKLPGGHFPSLTQVSSAAPITRPPKVTSSTVIAGKELPKENCGPVQASSARVEVKKPVDSSLDSTTKVSNNSEVGIYPSSFDPVHVPCPESSVASNVGVVGVRSQLSENSGKPSAIKDISLSASTDTTDPSSQTSVPETVVSGGSANKTLKNEATPQSIKEWKPKSGQKSSPNGPGIIGTPSKSSPSVTTDNLKTVEKELDQFQDKTNENSYVVFADHIQVSKNHTQLIFGSFGQDIEFSNAFVSDSQSVEIEEEEASAEVVDPLPCVSTASTAEEDPSSIVIPAAKNIDDLSHEQDNESSRFISQNPQDSFSNLPTFPVYYDANTGYGIPYYRPAMEDNVSPHQEASTPSLMVRQQPLLAQMYPQVHYANLMPYRQFLSPVYVSSPHMTIPGFSNNPTSYPPSQPSNGNSYMLMPGGSSSHVGADSFKYGIQQFKPVSAANPITGFGNYANHPTATGQDESSCLKYVPNPQQGEGSEMWIQNPRELMCMQQSYYYNNMAGQSVHGAYLQPHTGHSSFGSAAAAVAQQSHMQFPGMYHQPTPPPPPQHTTIANPHNNLAGHPDWV